MSLISFIKGKLKQREIRKLEPEENFQFEENYYGDINIIDGFNFIYCNNYTNKLYEEKYITLKYLSFISCVISLPTELKVIKDLEDIINNTRENFSLFRYNNINIIFDKDRIQLFLRGDINFYESICNNIHNNIFTKYIRNNILLEGTPIETPNEYLNNMYNSIIHPSKEVDILFIEDNIQCENLKPVVGLSMKSNLEIPPISLSNKTHITLNNREITYCQIDKLGEDELIYLTKNVKHGDKLLELVHKYITNNDYSDIDEIIEE